MVTQEAWRSLASTPSLPFARFHRADLPTGLPCTILAGTALRRRAGPHRGYFFALTTRKAWNHVRRSPLPGSPAPQEYRTR